MRLAWYWTDLMRSYVDIATMICSTASGTLAICSKQGHVWLLSIRRTIRRQSAHRQRVHRRDMLDVVPLHHWSIGTRIWSACFCQQSSRKPYMPTLMAFGTGNRAEMSIYRLWKLLRL